MDEHSGSGTHTIIVDGGGSGGGTQSEAGRILRKAANLIDGSRTGTHGDYSETLAMMAALWSAYLGQTLGADDAARMMAMGKIARASCGDGSFLDHDLDGAAYLAMAGAVGAKQ